jgi:hypothetical protein
MSEAIESEARMRAGMRGTQSFLHVFGECRRRPSLLLLELLWRWAFGIPLLLAVAYEAWRIYAATADQLAATGLEGITVIDPMRAAVIVANVYAVLAAQVLQVLLWLTPAAVVAWSVFSGVGRNAVLRRYDPGLPWRPGTLAVLQLLRVVFLGGSFVLWFAGIHWSADYALGGGEPSILVYCALVICLSLGIFTLWALVSWVFSIAPLLVLLEDRGVRSSLVRSLRLGCLTGKLVEINLVMGIIKVALVVLAMVWSAIPLPFVDAPQGLGLYGWWALGTVLYCVASDLFQVARLVAFVHFWRALQ